MNSIGEMKFQLVGTSWSGVRLLALAIEKSPESAFSEAFGPILDGRNSQTEEDEIDAVERAKSRVDHFQAACWQEAGKHMGRAWGHLTLTEQISGLLEPERGVRAFQAWPAQRSSDFDPATYFACRHLSVPTLFVVRDGRTCIPAKVKNERISVETAIADWRYSVHALRRFTYFHKRLLPIRVEDLISRPEETLSEACDFVQISCTAEMVQSVKSPEVQKKWSHDRIALAKWASKTPWINNIRQELDLFGYAQG